MRPVAIDGVTWSVSLSAVTVSLAKRLNRLRCCLGCRLGWPQGTIF